MRKRTPPTSASVPLVAPPQLLSIPEVARSLTIGRAKVYSLIKTEGLPAVQVGSIMRVSIGDLQTWVEQHTRASLVVSHTADASHEEKAFSFCAFVRSEETA